MKANPEHQRVLLDVADIDRRTAQAEHARSHPPQAARVSELMAIRQEQLRELTVATGARDDARTELGRIESDVKVVEQRRERDAARLAASTNPKDAVALEHELASLARRQRELEDAELEVMARVEDAEAAVAAQQALIDVTTAEGAQLSTEAKAHIAAAEKEHGELARDRAALTAELPPALLSDYERRATRTAGAALLRAGMCEGCRIVLSGIDLNRIRQQAADDIVSCPECNAILVRTEESGL
ncbi:putative nucleic acid-binding Zn-ribbon protein [Microbacterium keratanolyticum]|uniref:C4-type zinc ribbon domain-containing protein n=2 Tax=Microbacterium keratanolyticum TaxID=67574 RepID=A0A9W6HUQ7_9MICO|nr:C4-type zinc ribbon domain-containing protein [Microbacterium keratanolyticum]MBM7467535.1 putative nucleic acid-binding Zn-ribbon protein [Microbacterium keratanolyticum]GLK02524.1 hypothetical protein GCM10017596_22390 [Microbacterium keratanolyticum]